MGSDFQGDKIREARDFTPSNYEPWAFDKVVGILMRPVIHMTLKELKHNYGPWMDYERCTAPDKGHWLFGQVRSECFGKSKIFSLPS